MVLTEAFGISPSGTACPKGQPKGALFRVKTRDPEKAFGDRRASQGDRERQWESFSGSQTFVTIVIQGVDFGITNRQETASHKRRPPLSDSPKSLVQTRVANWAIGCHRWAVPIWCRPRGTDWWSTRPPVQAPDRSGNGLSWFPSRPPGAGHAGPALRWQSLFSTGDSPSLGSFGMLSPPCHSTPHCAEPVESERCEVGFDTRFALFG